MPLRPTLEARYVRPDSIGDYAVTSPATDDYNCLAWAAGLDDVWAWPGNEPFQWWPREFLRPSMIESISAWFESLGYEQTDSIDHEDGFERVAVYCAPDGEPTHASRELQGGMWTSKVGSAEDISHGSPSVLEVETGYGKVQLVFRRPEVSA